jgi:hypothetical protein
VKMYLYQRFWVCMDTGVEGLIVDMKMGMKIDMDMDRMDL